MKLLLVDDNKMLAKAIAKKVAGCINCEFDLAYNFEDAKKLIDENKYFAALLDLCLPDAMHGQVVDYALSKKLPSIILTGLDDDVTRQSFMDKDIVDYVLKDGSECIDYIIDIISRLKRNENTKIIVAEDSMATRNIIKNILQAYKFQVFPAAHGAEALGYLDQHPDVKLILTDKEMPAMSGEELIKEVRLTYNKHQLGLIVLTAHGSDEVGTRMLKYGANDFIQKPFSRDNLICRVNNSLDLIYYAECLRDNAEKDSLTNLNNRKRFFELGEDYYLKTKEESEFAIFLIDIDDMKKINETYGFDKGDCVIVQCGKVLYEQVKGADIIARFDGEQFCILVKDIKREDAVKLAVRIRSALKNAPFIDEQKQISFTASIGVCVGNKKTTLDNIIKNAENALTDAKENGKDRVEIYDNGEEY